MLYDLLKQDYMPRRKTTLTASAGEQTLILYPELKIAGRVTDARTGQPVPRFRVVKGWQSRLAGSRRLVREPGRGRDRRSIYNLIQ